MARSPVSGATTTKYCIMTLVSSYPFCCENRWVFLSPRQDSDLSLSRPCPNLLLLFICSLNDFLYKCWNSFHSPASIIHQIAIHSCISYMYQKQTSMFPHGLFLRYHCKRLVQRRRCECSQEAPRPSGGECCIFVPPMMMRRRYFVLTQPSDHFLS
jgi:hypothetical protein